MKLNIMQFFRVNCYILMCRLSSLNSLFLIYVTATHSTSDCRLAYCNVIRLAFLVVKLSVGSNHIARRY
jgi:hypothetical protein